MGKLPYSYSTVFEVDQLCAAVSINGKSTRARTGLIVHLTAPTIHAGWYGNVTLEIANLGPFHIKLQEFVNSIAQVTVAKITSPPVEGMKNSVTYGQTAVGATQD